MPMPLPLLAGILAVSPRADADKGPLAQLRADMQTVSSPQPPKRVLLPSVPCIQVLTLPNSTTVNTLQKQLQSLGLSDRVNVLVSLPDPEGKVAGCFRAHVNGWNSALSRGCSTLLMLEEDAVFQTSVLEQSFQAAENMVASGLPFDMIMLGYSPQFTVNLGVLKPLLSPGSLMLTRGQMNSQLPKCVFQLRNWDSTHAYIISGAAMRRWRNISFAAGQTPPIDGFLAQQSPNGVFGVRPISSMQANHASEAAIYDVGSAETGSAISMLRSVPGVLYSVYEPTILEVHSRMSFPAECMAPKSAYSYSGLSAAVESFRQLAEGVSSPLASSWAGPQETWKSTFNSDLPAILERLKHYDGPTSTLISKWRQWEAAST